MTHAGAVVGIVLAAGRSSRMGRPKAELTLGGSSFLDRCIGALLGGGCRSVVVVLGAGGEPDVPRENVRYARNPDPTSQPIDSIRIGLEALPAGSEAVAVLPVDTPAVRPDTVRDLIDAFRSAPGPSAPVVRPVYDGTAGHPTLFPRALFPELSRRDLPRGAESVVEAHARLDVAVTDRGVVTNVNTPEEYDRLVEGA